MIIRNRRGLTLIELLVAITISTVLGASVMSLLLTQFRLEERVESQRAARMVGRSAINVLTNTLRPVDPAWGIEAVAAASITVKAPYAMGLVCASTVTSQTVALMPLDSVEFAIPGYSGFAWRNSAGTYATVAGGTVTASGSFPASCTSAGILNITAPANVPNEKTRVVTLAVPAGVLASPLTVGSVVMLYRRITFSFANSQQAGLTTRKALWRDLLDDGVAATELVVPFDATAAFRYFVTGSTTATTTVPGTLSTMRGFEIFLPGESENATRRLGAPEQADLTTAVYFMNSAP